MAKNALPPFNKKKFHVLIENLSTSLVFTIFHAKFNCN